MESNIHRYLVRLTPLGTYFFGGEVTFGDGTTQNYLVHSQLLPQAAALLGVMRYAVLASHGLLETGDHEADAERRKRYPSLIGQTFDMENPSSDGYGIIKRLSPVFIEKKGHLFTPRPADYGCSVRFSDDGHTSFTSAEERPLISIEGDIRYTSEWISEDGATILSKADIFLTEQRVGITRKPGVPDDKSFFKQTVVRLADGCSFCFTVDTSEPLSGLPSIVQLGGDRSLSHLELEPCSDDIVKRFSPLHCEGRLVLLSDAYLPTAAEWQAFDFVWGESVTNRYTANAHKSRRKSLLYHLLSRGSVVYHRDSAALNGLLAENPLNRIGLNIFI
ncbi:MAG: type III-B CRISPR module-associated protein Cmr3 [Bacteroidales bacterium]|nr:type III-B CRISPR module-associated protein Cmr3 [Bacteroidales bacterium]